MEIKIEKEYAGNFKWYRHYYNTYGDIIKTEVLDMEEHIEDSIAYQYEYKMDNNNRVQETVKLQNQKILEKNKYYYEEKLLIMRELFTKVPYQIADLTFYYEYSDNKCLYEIKVCLESGEISYFIRDKKVISPIQSQYSWKLLSNKNNSTYIQICEPILTLELQEELLLYTVKKWDSKSLLILDIQNTDVNHYENDLLKLQSLYRKKYKLNTCYDM